MTPLRRFVPVAPTCLVLFAIALPVLSQGTPPTILESVLASGRDALAKGKTEDAQRHFRRALELAPGEIEALRGLLQLSDADPAARAIWSQRLSEVLLEPTGLRIDSKLKRLMSADDPWPARLAEARAAALKELMSFAKSERGRLDRIGATGLLVAWLRPVLEELLEPSPFLAAGLAASVDPLLAPAPRREKEIMKKVEQFMASALAEGRFDQALKAGLILQGLHRQAGQKDLEGPPAPTLDAAQAAAAARAIAAARDQLQRTNEAPLTVAALQALAMDEREEFSRRHADPANPGVAVSPDGLYRIETTCGFETLLGVALTIELHHRRLAGWYGVDPFAKRQGTVRIVPEAQGLEAEGAPYWWAGGFQGGDVTTVRFSVGDIEGLGHTLTHELTHRFDSVIVPFQPAWLVEGKASWTGGAYAAAASTNFVANHADYGSIEAALIKGYGDVNKLGKLVDGNPDDYRDNYTAGYALYVYLGTWEESGRKLYATRFEEYRAELFKGRSRPRAFFEQYFCDGKDGRPADFAGFAAAFGKFLSGFHWLSRADWVSRYTTGVGERPPFRWVYDTETWVWTRNRAEPYFGQDHFGEAGDLFDAAGRPDDAASAWLWSFDLDEWDERRASRLAEILAKNREARAAWFLRARIESARADTMARTPAPFLRDLPRLAALLGSYAEAAADYRRRGLPRLESLMAAERRLIAAPFGSVDALPEGPEPDADTLLAPFDRTARRLDLAGWVEDKLSGYDEYRVKGLWYLSPEDDLHVGRSKPRDATGVTDARANRAHIFVRTADRQRAGRYRIDCRITFTTSFVSGAVVLGSGRRDRNIRLRFSAGDYMYAIGQSTDAPSFASLSWGLSGLFDRDSGLPGAAPGGRFDFGSSKPSFRLTLIADGAEVVAWIDGKLLGAYQGVTGLPVEGPIGFAADFGAYKVSDATVRRLDRSEAIDRDADLPHALDPRRDTTVTELGLRNRRVRGLPLRDRGVFVIWIPTTRLEDGALDVDDVVSSARFAARGLREGVEGAALPQKLVLALPEGVDEATARELVGELGPLADAVPILRHRHERYFFDLSRPNMPAEPHPVLLFVDPVGTLRFVDIYPVGMRGIPDSARHWGRVFRNGRAR